MAQVVNMYVPCYAGSVSIGQLHDTIKDPIRSHHISRFLWVHHRYCWDNPLNPPSAISVYGIPDNVGKAIVNHPQFYHNGWYNHLILVLYSCVTNISSTVCDPLYWLVSGDSPIAT